MTSSHEVYVRLLDEGVPVLRPVPASSVGQNTFLLGATPNYDADDEKWEFPPGTVVVCESQEHQGQQILVAVARRDD